jgi:hypothetical protein
MNSAVKLLTEMYQLSFEEPAHLMTGMAYFSINFSALFFRTG